MGRKRKATGISTLWAIGVLLAIGIMASYPYISGAILGVIVAAWLVSRRIASKQILPTYDLSKVDEMSGSEFEEYIAALFSKLGYSASATQKSRDFGVDVIAERRGEKIAIQTKRYAKAVNLKAVQEVVAGMHKYGCNRCMVVTNNYFTPSAKELADHSGCELVDRDELSSLILSTLKDQRSDKNSSRARHEDNSERQNAKVVVACRNCGQQLRLQAGREGNVSCPACNSLFYVAT